jgi:hypothetical protein
MELEIRDIPSHHPSSCGCRRVPAADDWRGCPSIPVTWHLIVLLCVVLRCALSCGPCACVVDLGVLLELDGAGNVGGLQHGDGANGGRRHDGKRKERGGNGCLQRARECLSAAVSSRRERRFPLREEQTPDGARDRTRPTHGEHTNRAATYTQAHTLLAAAIVLPDHKE